MTKKTVKRKQEEVEKENEPKKRMSDEPAAKKVFKYLIFTYKNLTCSTHSYFA